MLIRLVQVTDDLWPLLEPVVRGGETYSLPTDLTREQALQYWLAPEHEVWVAEDQGRLLATYYLQANQRGGGDHVANCGYISAAPGLGRKLCQHSLERARERGFLAMQFNFVLASNERAVRLWESLGFLTIGRIPRAYRHPRLGFVDALIMHRFLTE